MNDILFNNEDKYFKLSTDTKTYHFNYNLEVNQDFEEKDFKVYFFYKNNYNENDIYQIYLNNMCEQKTRLGYLFPLEAIESTSHNYAEDIFFHKYAFVAYKHIIHEFNKNNLFENFNDTNLKLEDVIKENLFIFILSRETLRNTLIKEFCIDNFLPSFYLNGLVPFNFNNITNLKKNLKDFPVEKNKLYIYETSDALLDNKFILNVFKNIFPTNNDDIIDFFYSYQIVELLMDKVFTQEMQLFHEDVAMNLANPRKVSDAMNLIKDIIGEKKRIHLIEHSYTTKTLDTNLLKKHCNELLEKYNKSHEGEDLNTFFYGVRNLVFHEYRVIESSIELRDIAEEFTYMICHLVIYFKLKTKETSSIEMYYI